MPGGTLLGDVGGTNVRFATSDGPGNVRDVRSYLVTDYPRFDDALATYLAERRLQGETLFGTVRIAAAGPVEPDGMIVLTNSPWQISRSDLCTTVGIEDARLYNDLEAVALALPHLPRNERRCLGGVDFDTPVPGNMLAINVGTGFGAAIALLRPGEPPLAVATEAGHMTFAGQSDDEQLLAGRLESVEDFLSGKGVLRAYQIFRNMREADALSDLLGAPEIFAASPGNCAANQTLCAFTDVLARISGNLVLATGSWAGCYFCGSVVEGWAEHVDERLFRGVFTKKGKMSERMQRVPTSLILYPQPALYGLSFAA